MVLEKSFRAIWHSSCSFNPAMFSNSSRVGTDQEHGTWDRAAVSSDLFPVQ